MTLACHRCAHQTTVVDCRPWRLWLCPSCGCVTHKERDGSVVGNVVVYLYRSLRRWLQ